MAVSSECAAVTFAGVAGYLLASAIDAGTSVLSDCFQPSATLSLVTASESTTRKGAASLPISAAGRGAGGGDADLVGLVGDQRGDVAALDHVERRRLVEVERDDLGVAVAGRAQRRQHAQRRLGPGDVDAVEIGVLGQHRLGDLLAARRVGHARPRRRSPCPDSPARSSP